MLNKNDSVKLSFLYNSAFKKLLKIEGGYVDDPADSGGKTRYGITEKVARSNGYKGSMKNLPIEVAKYIYKKKYWDELNLDLVNSVAVCEELFDSCVNVGTKRTIKWLQLCLNVLNLGGKHWSDLAEDGVVGTKTIAAINTLHENSKWEKRFLKAMNCLQGAFYITLAKQREKDERFIAGWLDMRVKF